MSSAWRGRQIKGKINIHRNENASPSESVSRSEGKGFVTLSLKPGNPIEFGLEREKE